jgi:rare lipoprotein A
MAGTANRRGDCLLRFKKMDLIAGCLAVTSLWFVPLPPIPPMPSVSASAFAASVQTEVRSVESHHPLRALGNLGIASWYGDVLDGHPTASGEIFDKDQLTACHRTLPFGTMVRVVDRRTGKSVVVRINDRGVLSADRVIDLSSGAARELGILRDGVAPVRLEVLGRQRRVSPAAVSDAGTVTVAAAESPL